MSQLDFELKPEAARRFDAERRAPSVLVMMPKRIFFKILFSAVAVALSLYVWRQR